MYVASNRSSGEEALADDADSDDAVAALSVDAGVAGTDVELQAATLAKRTAPAMIRRSRVIGGVYEVRLIRVGQRFRRPQVAQVIPEVESRPTSATTGKIGRHPLPVQFRRLGNGRQGRTCLPSCASAARSWGRRASSPARRSWSTQRLNDARASSTPIDGLARLTRACQAGHLGTDFCDARRRPVRQRPPRHRSSSPGRPRPTIGVCSTDSK